MSGSEAPATKPVESVVPTPKQLAAAPGFTEYEAMRRGQGAVHGDADPPPDDAADTEVLPENKDDTTGASPETEASDGDADAGNKAADDRANKLPKWVQKRLEREQRRTEAARQEAAAWRTRAEGANAPDDREGQQRQTEEGGTSAGTTQTERRQDQGTVSDEPLPPEEYKFDYPEETDYVKDPDDAEGLAAFLEDVDRWEGNVPLKGGTHAEKPPDGGGDGGIQQQSQQQGGTEQGAGQTIKPQSDVDLVVQQQFADLRETLEDAEDDESQGDLAQDFFDQLQARRFMLSSEMLEWMADNDDAAKVAAEFVKSPRKANRVFRSPPTKHAQLLNEMVKAAGKKRPARATDNRDGKAVVGELNGRRPASPIKQLADAESYGSYEASRRALDKERRQQLR